MTLDWFPCRRPYRLVIYGKIYYGKKVWTVNAKDVEWVQCEHVHKLDTFQSRNCKSMIWKKVTDKHQNQAKLLDLKERLFPRLPRYVPYKGTFVPYDDTFSASDQGQMLDVWQGEDSQIHHLIRQIHRFTISSVRKKSNQKKHPRIRFSTTILDPTDKK